MKEAVLDYETLASGAEGTLIRVHLHTGRTHQIRVQFAARGCPLAGDGKYGGKGSAPLRSGRTASPSPIRAAGECKHSKKVQKIRPGKHYSRKSSSENHVTRLPP